MKRVWNLCFMFVAVCLLASGCGGSSSGGGSGGGVGPGSILLSGGNGVTGSGGTAGYFQIDTYGLLGIEVMTTGTVDTYFTVPTAMPDPEFGDELLDVTVDMTIDNYATQALAQAAVADGEYYMYTNNSYLRKRDSVGGDEIVTGLRIAEGATLTLGLNYNWSGATGQDSARVYCWEDIEISGTLTTKDLTTGDVGGLTIETRHAAPAIARDRGGLYMYASYNVFLRKTGLIDTSGDDAPAASNARGGDGGFVYSYASNGSYYVHGTVDGSGGNGDGAGIGGDGAVSGSGTLYNVYCYGSWGDCILTGTMTANGGDGADGGNAGSAEVYGDASCYVSSDAVMTSNGGNGAIGDGGNGNEVYIESYYSGCYVAGTLEAIGGTGIVDGGNGGDMTIYAADATGIGPFYFSGTFNGNAADGGTGDAGDAGDVYIEGYGGDIRMTGPISVIGGTAAAAGMSGGDGGDLDIYMYEGYDYANSYDTRPGNILVASMIDLRGGDGQLNGGTGGDLYVSNEDDDYDYYIPDYKVCFYGYTGIIGNGGSGIAGGSADYIEMNCDAGEWTNNNYASGPIVYNVPYTGNGGEGTAGTGGRGGEAYFYNEDGYMGWEGTATIKVTANFEINGADGTTGGGDGGYVEAEAVNGLEWSGNVNAAGGDATAADADGGDNGNQCYFYSTEYVRVSGIMNFPGGDAMGTGTGGTGGELQIYAGTSIDVTVTDFTLNGGDGDGTVGFGGDGGYLEVFCNLKASNITMNVWNVDEGTADTDGTHGYVNIDGTNWEH